jgi:hypothetical protein
MSKPSDSDLLGVLIEIRNWVRAAAHGSVKESLEAALPDTKARMAYQMFDGTASIERM